MTTVRTKTVFYHLLGNTLLASVTNAFVWFALTFWVFLETQSVLVTSLIAGTFAVSNMVSAFIFGGIVDHNKKRTAMMYSSGVSLAAYSLGALIFFTTPSAVFSDPASAILWVLIVVLMLGSVAGNLRTIALSTAISLLFTEGRDKANGMVAAVNGISFSLTSILSGLVIGFFGMDIAIVSALVATLVVIGHVYH